MASPHVGKFLWLIRPRRSIGRILGAKAKFDLDPLGVNPFGEIDALVVGRDSGTDDTNARRLQLGNDGILIRDACPQRVDDVNAKYKVFALWRAIGAICSQGYH